MEIISIRSEKFFVAPGVYALEAEIKTWDEAAKKHIYLHYGLYEGDHYSVAHESVLDYQVDDDSDEDIELLEHYESLAEAMVSNYIDGFILLHKIVNEMIDLTFGHRESIYNYIVSPIEFDEGDDEDEDILEKNIYATFQYQTKTMKSPVLRKAHVQTADSFVVLCCMYDENGNVLESFDDAEAAERSKWYLLYQNMIEKINGQI